MTQAIVARADQADKGNLFSPHTGELTRVCATCGDNFATKWWRAKYCSRNCFQKKRRTSSTEAHRCDFGVGYGAIYAVLTGKTWKHVKSTDTKKGR